MENRAFEKEEDQSIKQDGVVPILNGSCKSFSALPDATSMATTIVNGVIITDLDYIDSSPENSTFHHNGISNSISATSTTLVLPEASSNGNKKSGGFLIEKFVKNYIWPPGTKLARYLVIAIVCGFVYGILWSTTNSLAVPGGAIFALTMLIAACWVFGELVGKAKLPALLGMLIMGFILRNIPHLNIAHDLRPDWSAFLRNAALTIILTRAGMGLDPYKLKKMSWVCLRLACLPCIAEGVVAGLVAYWLLGFPILLGITLGFCLAGLSPAVVVPPMLHLQEVGLGVAKGIPTLGVFTAGVDDALSVAIFGVFLSITFSHGALWFTILQGPLEILIGVAFGVGFGLIAWYIPNPSSKSVVFPRFAFLMCGTLFAIFMGQEVGFTGAGAVGTLVLAFVAAIGWRKDNNRDREVSRIYAVVWLFMQPVLFGLIGAEIGLENLTAVVVGKGIAVIAMGLVARTIIGILSVLRSGFNVKEIIFIQFTCIPKATVQAAIGPLILDTARTMHAGEDYEAFGLNALMIAAISILICAPIGAITISFLAPKLLQRSSPQDIPKAEFEAE
ncbi:Sodium/hydrogen exchanger 9B2 [Chamberlinius hualienensis]